MLEPVGNVPVVVEDDVMVGGNAGIYEGTIVRRRAVIGTGAALLNGSTRVYDLVKLAHPPVLGRGAADHPRGRRGGARQPPRARSRFAEEHGLQLATPLIVKYRDEKTDAATALEEALR